MKTLSEIATADLTPASSIQAMARAEGFDRTQYTIALADRIRSLKAPIDNQRERLAQLALLASGTEADQFAADELAAHFTILSALFERFARSAADLADNPGKTQACDIYLNNAVKAQRAAMGTLSAIKILRDGKP